MKILFYILLIFPFNSSAQNELPRFDDDTLYCSGGYKVYEGQVLHLANGTSAAGYFRYIKFHSSMARTDTYTMQNGTVLVKKLRNYKNSGPENQSIRVQGIVTYSNKSTADVDFFLEFEKSILSPDRLQNELIVPKEFLSVQPQSVPKETTKSAQPAEVKKQNLPEDLRQIFVADEIKKLFDLYKSGALTKEEYEAQKKKLLAKQ